LEIEIYKVFASVNVLDLANYDGKDIYTWAKEYLFCTTVDDNDPEYCNSQGIYWDYSNYPEPLN